MNVSDIRWQQRLENYSQALSQLKEAFQLAQTRTLSELENQGVIQAFEYTHELAWNVLKDYFQDQGNSSITGSKDAAREAFQKGLIINGQAWMEMVKSRNKTSHTYNKNVSKIILAQIFNEYYPEFLIFEKKMNEIKEKQNV
jgi:nucleotidyltransferase substrate binding protein (TIGR01987 family)